MSEEILQRHDLACAVFTQLCMGERGWRMSIPARPDEDPDLLIGAALNDIPELVSELEEMKANYHRCCQTVAAMHAAAMGEVCGPKRGVVEDVEDLLIWARHAYEAIRLAERLRPLGLHGVVESAPSQVKERPQ